MLQPYQVDWWDDPIVNFDINAPLKILGQRHLNLGDNGVRLQYSLSAAVMAVSPEDAKQQIVAFYVDDVELQWQFIVAQPFGWPAYGYNRPPQPGSIWDQRPH